MRKSLALAALFTLIFSGCSRLKLAYDMLPWLLERQAKKYVSDLRPDQLAKLKEETKAYVEWHRRVMMPPYAAALRTVAAGLSQTSQSHDGELLAPAVLNGLYAQTVEPLYLPAAELLASLDDRQIETLRRALEKKASADEKAYLAEGAQPLERRVKRLQDNLEDFFGELNEVQLRQVRRLCEEFPMPYEAWIRDRRERAEALVAMLREKKGLNVIQAHLRDWWTKARAAGRKREDYQWDEDQMTRFTEGVLIMLTPPQKLHAARKLMDMAAQLDDIAHQPRPEPKPTAGAAAPVAPPAASPQAR